MPGVADTLMDSLEGNRLWFASTHRSERTEIARERRRDVLEAAGKHEKSIHIGNAEADHYILSKLIDETVNALFVLDREFYIRFRESLNPNMMLRWTSAKHENIKD